MKTATSFRLNKLTIVFSKAIEEIMFTDVSYFYGQMGSGKTSIARLIDYCFGGSINLSPALLLEFVTVELHLTINGKDVKIERPRDSELVIAEWEVSTGEHYTLQIPVSSASGIVLPGTKVEVLSDLLYHLADVDPPKVRRSKIRENSDLQRLSFRDLFWYCYVDQDNIDSSFFHLDEDAHTFKRLKSRDVLRFILGFHQEQVAELESELQELQIQKLQLNEAAKSLKDVLKETHIGSEEELNELVIQLENDLLSNSKLIQELRDNAIILPHAVDIYKTDARNLSDEIEAIDNALISIRKKIDQDKRHKNEILTLSVKVQRMAGARAVLGGVSFQSCPRCTQTLPQRDENKCIVCGQVEPSEGEDNLEPDLLKLDAKARITELDEIISLQEEQTRLMEYRRNELTIYKDRLDNDISVQSRQYDSAYLSNVLRFEKDNAQIREQIDHLNRLKLVARKANDLLEKASSTEAQQITVRSKLKEARMLAESDLRSLERLKALFLNCLLRCKLPGIDESCVVHISPKDFLPIVENPSIGDIAVTSFSNLSSGGKKTLFKACFAVAVHRLVVEIGAFLPSLLIIDSAMKNISERENMTQFENFNKLIYELASTELRETQMIVIDKEYFDPPEGLFLNMSVRHMTLDNPVYPPLIPYYKG